MIGIITHYDVHNHGALLQLNGLIKTLRVINKEAKALQFDKNYDFLGIDFKEKYNISLKSIPFYLKYLLEKGVSRTLFNMGKKRSLEQFKVSENLIGKYYTDYDSLETVIIGSDEVFALHTGPTPVFWGHALPSDNVVAYAGCFGPTTIADIYRKHCTSFVKSGISSMTAVSVRDVNSRDIITELVGVEPTVVCDPVILYGYENEIKTLPKVNLRNFMVVYAYDESMNEPETVEAIRRYAKEHNLKIVSPGFYHKWADINVNASPVEILAYFRDAQYVVTDTFHGCVMALITGTEMAVKVKESNENKLGNLCKEYCIENRLLHSYLDVNEIFSKPVNWDLTNSEIKRRRALSLDFLKLSLNNECK